MSTSKQRAINHLLTSAGKAGKAEPAPLSVLEQFLFAICREGTTRDHADQAFQSLKAKFFDWNEVRVSLMREVADVLGSAVPEPDLKAQRILEFLQEVFETTFSFDLEPVVKKGLKPAAKQLARYKAASDYAVAWVIQHSLGGHAIPLDVPSIRVLRRLGLLEEGKDDPETLRASIEHQVPKAKALPVVDLVSAVAEEWCFETDPNCPRCPLLSVCPTGQERTKGVPVAVGAKKGR